ncbi:WD repeat-containing protein 1-B-like isoform X1 [Orbicella faveolata]|uniref:WD repeat-containing protein 1-B-like isoform X1 n=1 Tax=Orbicella faveolata TaxID=48498 RepID=UPI0009E31E8C|nr:WD repeat-containing protein 1-B-like isoform X1 [Orbicella faveolata]
MQNPKICDVYSQHAKEATVAVYAPSGYYIASGDVSGKLRIWDTTQKEHLLKYEYQPLSGAIKDIAWSPDSKRIVVCGEGREKFGSVFLWDSGSSVGSIDGHNKSINAVDYKPTRPFRICTASEDKEVGFFEGPPFKFHHFSKGHTNFVNCVKYSPDGEHFVSGGADGQIFLFNGKTGEETCSLGGGKAHKGGIYGLSWSPDNKFLLSASADKTAKIWDIAANTCSTEFTFGNELEHQQLGCLWQGEYLLTIALSGNVNYLDANNPSSPIRIIKGHNKNILSLASSKDGSTLYSGSFDSRICQWKVQTGNAEIFKGQGHKNQVSDMVLCGDSLVTCSMDDTVRFTSVQTLEYGSQSVGMGSQPMHIDGKDGLTVVACLKDIAVLRDGNPMFSLPVEFEPQCTAVHPGQTDVAVGGKTNTIHIYTVDNNTLAEKTSASLPERVNMVGDLAYSPDGAYLASADDDRRVTVFTSTDYKRKVELTGPYGRVTCLAWTPDSQHLACGGLDTNLFIYNMEDPSKKIQIRNAHPQTVISRVTWLDNNTLVSAGHDCCLRFWSIKHN